MARYRITAQGNRGTASRCGSARSGGEAVANGWNISGRVTIRPDGSEKDCDSVFMSIHSGSKGYPKAGKYRPSIQLAFRESDGLVQLKINGRCVYRTHHMDDSFARKIEAITQSYNQEKYNQENDKNT